MKFDGFLICADHDGTVAQNGELLPQNKEAIDFFQQNGGIFTVATGRRQDFAMERYQSIIKPHVPIIIANGTMIFDMTDDLIIHRDFLCADDYGMVFDAFSRAKDAVNLRIELESETLLFNPREDNSDDITARLHGREISKFVLDFTQEDKALELQGYLTEKFGHKYSVVRSWPTGLETFSKTAGKGGCLNQIKAHIKQYLGTEIHTTIGMGDFENDISLIESADIGVAMGNAPDHVKARADIVIGDYADGAFAKYIYSL